MPRGSNFHKPYPSEFRREAVELVRGSGRPLREIAVDLGISTESLRMWVTRAEVDAGRREGLTSEERAELRELRRKVKTLEQEREILKKQRSFSRGRARRGDGVPVHRGGEDQLPDLAHVPDARGVPLGLSRVGAAAAVGPRPARRGADRPDPGRCTAAAVTATAPDGSTSTSATKESGSDVSGSSRRRASPGSAT